MDKMKILSIGGLEEKIPEDITEKIDVTHWENAHTFVPKQTALDADAIVVILKFAGKDGMSCAKAASADRLSIPVIPARTWNYVIHEILNCQKLSMWHSTFKEEPPDEEPVIEQPIAEKDKLTDMQVPIKKLWESYEDLLTEGVQNYLGIGQKYDIEDFLPILMDHTGLSKADVLKLLPFLSVSGIIENTVGDTWRRPSPDGFVMDLEPAPKPEVQRQSQTDKILGLIRGLGPGPFPSKYAIETAMMRHKEFVTVDGKPLARPRAYFYVRKAFDAGVITEDGSIFNIEPDETVKLTPLTNDELRSARLARNGRPAPTAPAEPALKVSDDVKFLRSIIGTVEKPIIQGADPDHAWDVIRGLKALIPQAPWDKMADNTVMRLLRKKSVSPRPIPRVMFTQDEWDALAWDCIKDFKVEVMAPFLKSCYYDEEIKCRECGQMFVFAKGEKSLYFDRELSQPRHCAECRKGRVPA